MKSKTYRCGKVSCRTYLKKVGNGYECGFIFDSSTIFVGNFIHQKEASQWYALMSREIGNFSRKYKVGSNFQITWYRHFLKNQLYKTYYSFVDRILSQHNRTFLRAVKRDVRKYNRVKNNWYASERKPVLKAA